MMRFKPNVSSKIYFFVVIFLLIQSCGKESIEEEIILECNIPLDLEKFYFTERLESGSFGSCYTVTLGHANIIFNDDETFELIITLDCDNDNEYKYDYKKRQYCQLDFNVITVKGTWYYAQMLIPLSISHNSERVDFWCISGGIGLTINESPFESHIGLKVYG
jgi:hypothetical protein